MEHTHHEQTRLLGPWDEYEFEVDLGRIKVTVMADRSHHVTFIPNEHTEIVLQQETPFLERGIEVRMREVY